MREGHNGGNKEEQNKTLISCKLRSVFWYELNRTKAPGPKTNGPSLTKRRKNDAWRVEEALNEGVWITFDRMFTALAVVRRDIYFTNIETWGFNTFGLVMMFAVKYKKGRTVESRFNASFTNKNSRYCQEQFL